MDETSISLLERLRGRPDDETWSRLAEIYTPLLRRWVRRYDLQDADQDDLVQDVLGVVFRELPGFQHNGRDGAFRAWLRTILVNRLRHFWRARQYRPAAGGNDLVERLEQLADENAALSRLWNEEHDRHVLHQLLEAARAAVAPQTWRAFRLVVLDGRPAEAVAAEVGMSRAEVYVAKSRVLRRLRELARGLVD